jgi:4-hydroxysphinganine ceramide fatty acyl 2-hydroxylase
VFPPLPAGVLAAAIYQILKQANSLFEDPLNLRLLFAGGIIGYLCYDMTHYYIHFRSPRSKYFYFLKRYHHNHHFVNPDKAFGISSPLWDKIFRTEAALKQLKYSLKW